MFGFLNPHDRGIRYRSAYARCCQFQHLHYGIVSLPFHTFESVFLYSCALDANAVDREQIPRQECCRLRASKNLLLANDASVGLFTASTSVLLMSIKCDDDIQDCGSVKARILKWLLQKEFARAWDYFAGLDNNFAKKVPAILAIQSQLERSESTITLEEYSAPSAQAYEYLFRLLARLPGLARFADSLGQIGAGIGGATVAYDCAKDWRKDRRRGQVNPVRSTGDAIAAMTFAQAKLRAALEICLSTFGTSSLTHTILTRVHDDIYRVVRKNCRSLNARLPSSLLSICPQTQPNAVTLYSSCGCAPCEGCACEVDSKLCYCGCCCGMICSSMCLK